MVRSSTRLVSIADVEAIAEEWDALAPNPFLTVAWLRSWDEVFGDGRSRGVAIREDGAFVAGAWLPVPRRGSELWAYRGVGPAFDAPAADETARAEAWRALVADAPDHVRLNGLQADTPGTAAARDALHDAGYRTYERPTDRSPFLELPDSEATLLGSLSRNARSQIGRKRRALAKQGALQLVTHTDGDGLDELLTVEASGWKGREGSAIASSPDFERQFRLFVERCAPTGGLRIHLLQLDGRTLAADLAVRVRDTAFLLKTGYDEAVASASPGLVLRAMVLAEMIREGATAYDFLGDADAYKTRWGGTTRQKLVLSAHRGPRELPRFLWHGHVRPRVVPLAKRVLRRT